MLSGLPVVILTSHKMSKNTVVTSERDFLLLTITKETRV